MNEVSKRTEAELAAIGAFVLEALLNVRTLEKIMSSVADLTTKVNAALAVLDSIKADVDALKAASGTAPADLETAVTSLTDKVAALRSDVPVSTPTPPPVVTPLPGS